MKISSPRPTCPPRVRRQRHRRAERRFFRAHHHRHGCRRRLRQARHAAHPTCLQPQSRTPPPPSLRSAGSPPRRRRRRPRRAPHSIKIGRQAPHRAPEATAAAGRGSGSASRHRHRRRWRLRSLRQPRQRPPTGTSGGKVAKSWPVGGREREGAEGKTSAGRYPCGEGGRALDKGGVGGKGRDPQERARDGRHVRCGLCTGAGAARRNAVRRDRCTKARWAYQCLRNWGEWRVVRTQWGARTCVWQGGEGRPASPFSEEQKQSAPPGQRLPAEGPKDGPSATWHTPRPAECKALMPRPDGYRTGHARRAHQ